MLNCLEKTIYLQLDSCVTAVKFLITMFIKTTRLDLVKHCWNQSGFWSEIQWTNLQLCLLDWKLPSDMVIFILSWDGGRFPCLISSHILKTKNNGWEHSDSPQIRGSHCNFRRVDYRVMCAPKQIKIMQNIVAWHQYRRWFVRYA